MSDRASTVTGPASVAPLAAGLALLDGRLQITGVLGSGSVGVVYRADDRRLGRQVAVKALANVDGDRLYQLKREFRTLARMSHPNLVKLYELCETDGVWLLIMELVEGVELGHWLRARPARPRVLAVMSRLCEALRALHAAGQVHRDVKPSNVVVTPADDAILLDFGLAASIRDAETTLAAGTLAYIAPEQLRGRAPGTPADWYSFGVVLFEALTGRLPFSADEQFRPAARHLTAGPKDLSPDVPEALDRLVRDLLLTAPEARPDAIEVGRVLGVEHARPTPSVAADSVFVGRQASLDTLRASLERVRQGASCVVHIHGPSGIGKTALARQFLSDVRGAGRDVVLEGSCHPQESVPYKALDAVIDNLTRHLVGLDDRAVLALAPRYAGALLHLFPVLGRAPGVRQWPVTLSQDSPSESRRRGFDALRELIDRLSDQQPVIIWIDDVQWSDRDSGAVLRTLLAPPDRPRLLLLLTSRQDVGRGGLFDDFEHDAPTVDIAMGPLAPEENTALARTLADRVGSGVDATVLAREAAGSPFLMQELARHFGEAPVGIGGAASFTIADVVRSRLLHLSGPARRLLEVVSVAGRPLDVGLAIDVASLGAAGQLLARALCADSWLRLSTLDEQPHLETYHDRIRELVVADLAADDRRTRHRELATAIRAGRNPDARTLVQHYVAADDRLDAAEQAVIAADEAEADLAFDQAVEMYDVVLRMQEGARRDRAILERRARALANAARRVDAALAFEEAAAVTEAGDHETRLALRGQAAEQFFCSGELRQGLGVLEGVLVDMDVRVPAAPLARLAAGLALRGRFIARRRAALTGREAELDTRTRTRLDALWRVARGAVMLDHTLADVLAGRHLLEALARGDSSRALRALGLEAAFEANIGGRWFRSRSRRLLQEIDAAASRIGDPYDRTWVLHCRAVCAWFDGRWRDCVELGTKAEAGMKRTGSDVFWDLSVLQGFMLSALAHLGELRALSSSMSELTRDAERRDDRYALRVFRTGDAVMAWLVADDVETALQVADATLEGYEAERFTAQHRHHLVATVHSHLYAGDGARAWDRVQQAWPVLRWSGFLALDCLGTQLRYLRGCAAVAAARARPAHDRSRHALAQVAVTEARRIRRSALPMAAPMAAALDAGAAGLAGRRAAQERALRAALLGFEKADMALYREATRWHLSEFIPGDDGRQASAGWMASEGVVRPASLARAVVPEP